MSTKKQVKANVDDTKREVKCKDFLVCLFTETELKEFSEDMALGYQDLMSLESEKKSVMSEFTTKITGKETEISSLARKISNKQEHRHVDCVMQMNVPRDGVKRLIRLDTGEMVWERNMSSEEMQLKLSLENEENVSEATAVHSEYEDNHK